MRYMRNSFSGLLRMDENENRRSRGVPGRPLRLIVSREVPGGFGGGELGQTATIYQYVAIIVVRPLLPYQTRPQGRRLERLVGYPCPHVQVKEGVHHTEFPDRSDQFPCVPAKKTMWPGSAQRHSSADGPVRPGAAIGE